MVASWPEYRFLRTQVRWSDIPNSLRIFQFVVIHTVKGFNVLNEAANIFLEFPCFFLMQQMLVIWSLVPLPFLNPACTSGSSRFTYCWSLAWRKDFEHYPASMWNECNCAVVWAFFGIGMKTDLFQSWGHCWVFQICWHIECSTFTSSSFKDLKQLNWNSITYTSFVCSNAFQRPLDFT